jgi:hypothetical protein
MKLFLLKVLNGYFNLIEPLVLALGASKSSLLAFYVNFYGFLLGYSEGIRDALVIQSALETGWFSNQRFVTYNNPFGMRVARTRYSFAAGEFTAHAYYNSISAGVCDRFAYDFHWNTDTTSVTAYVADLVKNGYAEATGYMNLFRNMLSGSMWRVKDLKQKTIKTTSIILTITTGLFAIVFFLFKRA